jgi:hypothetical protein
MRCANLLKLDGVEQVSEHKYWAQSRQLHGRRNNGGGLGAWCKGWCINLAKDDGRRKPKLLCFVGSLAGLCFYLRVCL